jgi:NIMA (never in mitosis gene a)-related kinase
MHRDIKCLNIFLADQKTIKLGDMGVSKVAPMGLLAQGTRVGTPLYLAPELVQAQPYDHKIDIWATGCALYHLACLEPPFHGDNLVTLGNAIAHKKPKPVPHVYSNKFQTFVERLLKKNPRDRPTALEAIGMIPAFVSKGKGGEES